MTFAEARELLANLAKILASDGGLATINRIFGENAPNAPGAIAAAAAAAAAPRPGEPTPVTTTVTTVVTTSENV